jgi:hypothetical protein
VSEDPVIGLFSILRYQLIWSSKRGLESPNLAGDLRDSMEDVTPELMKHDALGSLKNIKVDVAGFTGLQLSGKAAGIQLSVMEEVRKSLKEHTQASIKKLEVHDMCLTWQKVSGTDLKPLMEKLVDSFAELPSPFSSSSSSSLDENSPSPDEFPEAQLFFIATENSNCKPLSQAPPSAAVSSIPFLLLRIPLDIETLNKLVEQHQAATLKPANCKDLKNQSQAPNPDSKDSSSSVCKFPGVPSDGSFKPPQQSSKVVTDQDCQSLKVPPILQPDGVNSSCHLKTSAELQSPGSADQCDVVDEPQLQNLQLPKMQAQQELDINQDPDEDQYHDVVILELQDFERMDEWRPWVEEEDGDQTDTGLEFLFPAYVKYQVYVSESEEEEDHDKRETVELKPQVKVAELVPTRHKKAGASHGSQLESSLRFRARKGGLKKSPPCIAVADLFKRAKQAVSFADEAQTNHTYEDDDEDDEDDDDDEEEISPSLKSWEIEDGKETSQLLSKKHKLRAKAVKLPIRKFTRAPQYSKHWIGKAAKPTALDSCSSSEETGILHNMIPSSCGSTTFTCPRELLEVYKSMKDRSRIYRFNRSSTCVIPKETSFGGSALTDAQQIRQILRASHKTFASLSTFELLRLEFD